MNELDSNSENNYNMFQEEKKTELLRNLEVEIQKKQTDYLLNSNRNNNNHINEGQDELNNKNDEHLSILPNNLKIIKKDIIEDEVTKSKNEQKNPNDNINKNSPDNIINTSLDISNEQDKIELGKDKIEVKESDKENEDQNSNEAYDEHLLEEEPKNLEVELSMSTHHDKDENVLLSSSKIMQSNYVIPPSSTLSNAINYNQYKNPNYSNHIDENTYFMKISNGEIFYTSNPKKESNDQRIHLLTQPKSIEIKERMKQRELKEQQQVKEYPKHSQKVKVSNPSIVSQRLYNMHQQLKQNRKKLKREYEENLNKCYSISPDVNYKIIMSKNENIISNRNELEQENEMHNKPKVNQNDDIYTRVYQENLIDDKNQFQNLSNNKEIKEISTQLNYQGNINEIDMSPNRVNIDNFLERQKIYEEIKKDRLERKKLQSPNINECTFKPTINLTSDIIMKTNSSRAKENQTDKINRLYKQDYEKIKMRREQLESFYNAQYDYKPKINEVSPIIGREPSIHELNRGSISMSELKTSVCTSNQTNLSSFGTHNILFDCELSFQPKIINTNTMYSHIKSNYKADGKILNRINNEVNRKNVKIARLE